MKSYQVYSFSIRSLIIVVILIGLFFRFTNIDKKVYWIDEVHTAVRSFGYTRTEFVNQLAAKKIVSVEDLQTYQRLTPDKKLSDTINALSGNAEHSPLYYILVRFWMQCGSNNTEVQSTPLVTRSLSAVISLLAFPCIYWLCFELFKSSLVGWLAVALIAVSPFHVLYAQEAREYSLWTVTILLSSASLLWVIRTSKNKHHHILSWGIYAVTIALGYYSSLLFGIVAFAHGIYVFINQKLRFTKLSIGYSVTSIIGILAFFPWLSRFIQDSDGIGGWVARELPLLTLVKRWLVNFSSIFFDVQVASQQILFDIESGNDNLQFVYTSPYLLIVITILACIGYSIYLLCRQTPQKTWSFVLILIVVPALTFVLPDLISGGQRSSTARFITPCFLGVQIAMAYFLATQITSISVKYWQQKLWQIVMVALLTCGIISCAISSQANTWWNKYSSYYNPQIAEIINKSTHPLVISGAEKVSRLTSLSYNLQPQVQFLLVNEQLPKIPSSFSDVFLFRPSLELLQELEKNQNYKVKLVYQLGHLWQLENASVTTHTK